MSYNLYSLTEEELNKLCVESLFDRKSTQILKMIIWEEEDAEFYFQLAKNFIYDEDAKPFKVAKYFLQ